MEKLRLIITNKSFWLNARVCAGPGSRVWGPMSSCADCERVIMWDHAWWCHLMQAFCEEKTWVKREVRPREGIGKTGVGMGVKLEGNEGRIRGQMWEKVNRNKQDPDGTPHMPLKTPLHLSTGSTMGLLNLEQTQTPRRPHCITPL